MIKQNYLENKKLCNWYISEVVKCLPERFGWYRGSNITLKKLERYICQMNMEQLEDLFIMPYKQLLEKYYWIKEYDNLCRFIVYGSYYRKKIKKKGLDNRQKLIEFRGERLRTISDKTIDLIQENGVGVKRDKIQIVSSWKKYDEFVSKAKKFMDDINKIIAPQIDYSYLNNNVRCELVSRMKVNVCPYCNRTYIQPIIIDNKKRYTGDVDHFLPQSIFQLYSLSLWNLVPACKLCNQTFKGKRLTPMLNPIEAGFENDCFLSIEYHDLNSILGNNDNFDISWHIDSFVSEEQKEMIENNIKMFHLNEVYQYHKEDVRMILKRRHLLSSEKYISEVKKLVDIDDVEMVLMGTSMKPERFKDEVLAKMKYDAVKKN